MNQEKSLLRNTISLYIRMLFSVCINLYVSRIALKALGVDDFGIYNVVGGVIVLLGFINSSMSIASSRFLTLAMGRKNEAELQRIYNAAFVLHLSIAFIVFMLAETIGLWIVNCYLNIKADRIVAANYLYQFSIGAAIISFVQVPFLAMIMSDERMSVYARIDITNNLLKLAAGIAIGYFLFDRLIYYGFFLFLASIVVLLLYWGYCKKHYGKYKLSLIWDWRTIKPMMFFSGWDLLGCGGVSIQLQGRQILINRFFEVAMNAANGIALTVGSTLSVFTNNIIMAFRPRIIKCYSQGDMDRMSIYYEYAMIISLLLMNIVLVPLLLNLDFILSIWLIEIPPYTLELCKLTIIIGYIEVINTIVKIGIHASGKMRLFTIFSFIVNCAIVLLTYFFYIREFSVYSTYYIAFFLTFVNVIFNYILLSVYIPKLKKYKIVLLNIVGVAVCIIGFLLCAYMNCTIINESLLKFVVDVLLNGFVTFVFSSILFRKEINLYLNKK